MYFKINKKEFHDKLSIVSRAVSSYSPLPALSGIKFEVTNNEICLVASDSDISIKTVIKKDPTLLEIYREGSIVIEAKYILDIVRKIDSEYIEIEILDGCTTRISGNNSEIKIIGMYANEYPNIDFSQCKTELKMDCSLIKSIINETTFATTEKDLKPTLAGVNFKCDKNILTCVSTDGYRLSEKKVQLDESVDLNFNITIPAKSLNEVSKSLDETSNITLSISDQKIQFIFDNLIIQTRLIAGLYPDTSRLIPTSYRYSLTVDLKEMLSAIDRISFLKTDGISVICLSLNKNECVLSSKSKEVGSAIEILSSASYDCDDLTISFNGKFVYEALKVVKSQLVTLHFNGTMNPFMIKGVDDYNLVGVVLPVKTYV